MGSRREGIPRGKRDRPSVLLSPSVEDDRDAHPGVLLAGGELGDLLAFDLDPGHKSLLTPDEDDKRLLQA
jgi:hypothetical protein